MAALLALHRYSANNNQSIPRFLLIDQPTQVYFPSEVAYKAADGSVETTETDADLDEVHRLFELLRRFTEEDAPGFEIIVTEHANLLEDWFQPRRSDDFGRSRQRSGPKIGPTQVVDWPEFSPHLQDDNRMQWSSDGDPKRTFAESAKGQLLTLVRLRDPDVRRTTRAIFGQSATVPS